MPIHGDLHALLGLLEGRSPEAEGLRLRERLADEIPLRERWHRLRRAAEALDTRDATNGRHPAVNAETLAAFLEGRLPRDEARGIESIVWDSEPLLAEAISTYRFLAGGARGPRPRPAATDRYLAMFPPSEPAGSETNVRTAIVEPPASVSEIEPQVDEPEPRRRPPVVARRRRTDPRSTRRHWVIVAIVAACGLLAAITVSLFQRPVDGERDVPITKDVAPAPAPPSPEPPRVVDNEPEEHDPVPTPPEPPRTFVVAPTNVVGALFVRRENETWRVAESDARIDGSAAFLVPDSSWAALDVGVAKVVLAGPTEVDVRPSTTDDSVDVVVRGGRVGIVTSEARSPIRVRIESIDATITTCGAADVSVVATGPRAVLRLTAGCVSIDDRVLDQPTSLTRNATTEWTPIAAIDGRPAWTAAPTDAPPEVRRLAESVRGVGDVFGTILASAESEGGDAIAPLAAGWAMSLDPDRAVERLVARADTDREDTLLFALARQAPGDPRTRRAWGAIAERIGDPDMAARLARWHALATSRRPLDMETARELLRGLGHSHVLVRSTAIRTLRAKTRVQQGYDPRGTPADRARAQRLWTMELRRRLMNDTTPPPQQRRRPGPR